MSTGNGTGNPAHIHTPECGHGEILAELAELQARVDENRHAITEIDAGRTFGLRTLDLSQLRPVTFAWRPWLVHGAYNEIIGAEGVGKGTLTAYIVAGITTGTLPGDLEGQPRDVLYIGADEDGWEDAVGPRLHIAGADLSRVVELQSYLDQAFNMERDAAELDRLLGERQFGLVVVEQVLDVLPPMGNPNDPTGIRQATQPFRALLRRRGVTSLVARHINKGDATSYRQAGQGSVQFGAVARAGFLVAEHPSEPLRRVMVQGKANYSAKASMSFELAVEAFGLNGFTFEVSRAINFEVEEIDVADALGRKSQHDAKREERTDAILDVLTETPQSVRDIAETTGIPRSTVDRLLKVLAARREAVQTGDGWGVPQGVPPSHPLGNGTVGHPQSAVFDYDEEEDR